MFDPRPEASEAPGSSHRPAVESRMKGIELIRRFRHFSNHSAEIPHEQILDQEGLVSPRVRQSMAASACLVSPCPVFLACPGETGDSRPMDRHQ